jgi:hypothetical protein
MAVRLGWPSIIAPQSKVFFSGEKNQKTFVCWGGAMRPVLAGKVAKVFWFFSSEKNCFLTA